MGHIAYQIEDKIPGMPKTANKPFSNISNSHNVTSSQNIHKVTNSLVPKISTKLKDDASLTYFHIIKTFISRQNIHNTYIMTISENKF